jgi:hypothetical protein
VPPNETVNEKPEEPQPELSDAEYAQYAEADPRPEIVLTTEEHLVNAQAVQALTADPNLYQRGTVLVRVIRGGKKKDNRIDRDPMLPQIATLPEAILSERLTAVAQFCTYKEKKGKPIRIAEHPTDRLIRAVLYRGEWEGLRHLEGVVNAPMLRPDGSILEKPGYDESTGLLYEPSVEIEPIPTPLFTEDIDNAKKALLEVVADFPFSEEMHKAAWIASVLTPLARYAFSGPTPLFAIDSNIRGSGKGLLASVVSRIVCGRPMACMAAPTTDEEFQKVITSIALAGDQLVLIDNVEDGLGCPSFASMLTSTKHKGRILGKSKITSELPLWSTWFCTGNNLVFFGDVSRRYCHIRLESREANPEDRQGFKHADLLGWVSEERGRLLRAALVILKGYCAAGRPNMKLTPWGSYEGWSNLVRSAVVWAKLEDPHETRPEIRERSDPEAAGLPAILEGLEVLTSAPDNKQGIPASKIKELLNDPFYEDDDRVKALREALMNLCYIGKGDFPSPKSIGKKFQHLEGRVCEFQVQTDTLLPPIRKCLASYDPTHRGLRLWKVDTLTPKKETDHE